MPVVPPDLVFAARLLRRSPGFTLIAAISLALAIGANTTIFSVAKQLLFDRLDIPNAAGLRLLATADASFSYPVYEELRRQNDVLGDLMAFHPTAVNATVGSNAERVAVHEVSGNYYDVLGVRPQLGRRIRPRDDSTGARRACSRWRRSGGSEDRLVDGEVRGRLSRADGVNREAREGAKDVKKKPPFVSAVGRFAQQTFVNDSRCRSRAGGIPYAET